MLQNQNQQPSPRFSNESEGIYGKTQKFMHHLTPEKKKSRWDARNFGNARNGQKIILAFTQYGLNFDLTRKSWIVWCPSTFWTWLPYYHNTLNQLICVYLLEIFFFVLRRLILFTFSIKGLARFIKMARLLFLTWMFLWTSHQSLIKQLSITCFLSCEILVLKISRFIVQLLWVVFTRILGLEDTTTSVAAHKVTSSPSACLHRLFEYA